MAKVDGTDTSFYMNPAAYTQVKDEKKNKGVQRGSPVNFSKMFDDLRGKTANDLGPLQNLPVSEETVNSLMDDVRDAGDILKNRPLPEEIMRYKMAVRNFINYVVQNCYSLEYEEGLPNKLRPDFKGRRTSPGRIKQNYIQKFLLLTKNWKIWQLCFFPARRTNWSWFHVLRKYAVFW